MKLSIVIPCYNEENNVEKIYHKIIETLTDIKFEIIYIDDGSKDKTLVNLKKVYDEDPEKVRVVSFSRNFGKEAAIYAGLSHSTGEYTCIIDADLQQNPKYLVQMLEFLDKNPDYDQVAMVMKKRTVDSFIMKTCKKVFYKLIDKLSETRFEENASDFRMFRKSITEAIISLGEVNRFSKGIFSWVGFKTKYMDYEVEKRLSGQTKFNFKKSLSYAIDGIVGYTVKPLLWPIIIGILLFLSMFVYLVLFLILNLDVTISILLLVILFIGGVQSLMLGIIGEYLAKSYKEIKSRPIYLAKVKLGFEDDNIL